MQRHSCEGFPIPQVFSNVSSDMLAAQHRVFSTIGMIGTEYSVTRTWLIRRGILGLERRCRFATRASAQACTVDS